MSNFLGIRKIHSILICLISISYQKYIEFTLQSEKTETELMPLHFNLEYICNDWIPSLFNPVLTISNNKDTQDYELFFVKRITKFNNILYEDYSFACDLSYLLFNNEYKTYIAKCNLNQQYDRSYFGLSPSSSKRSKGFNDEEYNLALLKNNSHIDKTIFSFEKWEITDDLITSKFYLGDSHEHFKSTDGYIGKCSMTDDEYWGCSFDEMTFNDVDIPLSKDDESLYNIYFMSESYDIVFPIEFKDKLIEASNEKCQVKSYYLECEDLDEKEYIPLILSKEKMKITAEIDYFYNYCKAKDKPKIKTRIKFDYIDYIFFPLMMFKQFHIEFDANNKTISFYTKDSSILDVPSQTIEKIKSNFLKVFLITLLIILIIVVIIASVFGLYICLRKRRKSSSIEKYINKFNRFEDEDSFESINQQGLF